MTCLSCVHAGEAQVDAHALLLTCCVAIYMGFPFGMSTAATIRVGNLVGANRPAEARLSGPALAFQVLHLPFRFFTCLSGYALAFQILPFKTQTCLPDPVFAFPGSVLVFRFLQLPFRSCRLLISICACNPALLCLSGFALAISLLPLPFRFPCN